MKKMNNNLIYAKKLLLQDSYTLVLYDGKKLVTSFERGIKPLLELYEKGEDYSGFSVADKVIGKAAAFIYVLLGVNNIYTSVVSEGALNVFRSNNIKIEYEKSSPYIINRNGTDICPMERAVMNISSPEEAYRAICEAVNKLK